MGLGGPAPVPELDLSSGPEGDASFRFVESEARDMLLHVDSLPPLAVKLLRAMLANGARHSPKLGGEDPVSTFYSVVVSTIYHAMGGDFYNLKGMVAMLNFDPEEVTPQDQDALNQLARLDFNELGAAYCTAPTDDIVTAAQLLREHGRELLDHIGVSGVTDVQVEELAAMLGPAAVYLMQWASRHFPDFPPVLPSMNEAALSSPTHPRRARKPAFRPLCPPYSAGIPPEVSLAVAVLRALLPFPGGWRLFSRSRCRRRRRAQPLRCKPALDTSRYGFRSRGTQDCFAPSGRLAGTCGLINHHTRKGHQTK